MHGSIEGCRNSRRRPNSPLISFCWLRSIAARRLGGSWTLQPLSLGPWPCRRVSPRHAMTLLPRRPPPLDQVPQSTMWTEYCVSHVGRAIVDVDRLPIHNPISRYPRGHRFGRSWILGRTGGFAARQDFAMFREHDPRRLQPVAGNTCPWPPPCQRANARYALSRAAQKAIRQTRTQPAPAREHAAGVGGNSHGMASADLAGWPDLQSGP